MLLRYGYEGDFSDLGILPGDGTIDFKERTPEDIADQGRSSGSKSTAVKFAPTGSRQRRPFSRRPSTSRASTDTPRPSSSAARRRRSSSRTPGPRLSRARRSVPGSWRSSRWAARVRRRSSPDGRSIWRKRAGPTPKRRLAGRSTARGQASSKPAPPISFSPKRSSSSARPRSRASRAPHDKGRRLIACVGAPARRAPFLGSLEPLQYPPTSPLAGRAERQGFARAPKGLAQNGKGLCVVTTRYRIRDIEAYATAPAAATRALCHCPMK